VYAGQRPSVIARGGFSGLFPESSDFANQMALGTSVHDVVVLCNLQLTKDGVGICQGDIRLDNTTNIAMLFEKGSKTYKVNGQDLTGWFALDFTADQLLANVSCKSQKLNLCFIERSYSCVLVILLKSRYHVLQEKLGMVNRHIRKNKIMHKKEFMAWKG